MVGRRIEKRSRQERWGRTRERERSSASFKFRISPVVGFGLPGPKSSLTCNAHSTLWAMSKYGNIFNLMTWLAISKKASGSMMSLFYLFTLLTVVLFDNLYISAVRPMTIKILNHSRHPRSRHAGYATSARRLLVALVRALSRDQRCLLSLIQISRQPNVRWCCHGLSFGQR